METNGNIQLNLDTKDDEENVAYQAVKIRDSVTKADSATLLAVTDRLFMLLYIGSALILVIYLFSHAYI